MGLVSVGTKPAMIFSIFDVKNLLNLSASIFGFFSSGSGKVSFLNSSLLASAYNLLESLLILVNRS